VDRGGIGGNQHVEFAKSVGDGPTVKARNDLARIGVMAVDEYRRHAGECLRIAEGFINSQNRRGLH
jgi:hypothetical protein